MLLRQRGFFLFPSIPQDRNVFLECLARYRLVRHHSHFSPAVHLGPTVVLLWEYVELRAAEPLYSVSKQLPDYSCCLLVRFQHIRPCRCSFRCNLHAAPLGPHFHCPCLL
eukprot:18921_5